MRLHRIYLLTTSLLLVSTPSLRASQVTVAWSSAPRTLDPRYVIDANSHYLADLSHCALVGFDPSGKLIPQAAASWHWHKPTVAEFRLKAALKFSDGSPLQASDVKATYDFFLAGTSQSSPSPLNATFKTLTRVEVVAPDRIRFHLSEVDATFINNFVVGILPAKLARGERLTKPTGASCGPFTLEKLRPHALTLKRNPHYSIASLAKIETLVIKIVKDETTRYSKLLKGEVDFVQNGLSSEKMATIDQKHYTVQRASGQNVTYLGFNFKDPLLQKKALRQAIGYAIDRKAIIKHMLNGAAQPASGFLSADNPFVNPTVTGLDFDPKRAESILDKAGFKAKSPNGIRLQLSLKTTSDKGRLNVVHVIAAQLKRVGIAVKVQSLEWGKFKGDIEKGQAQLWILNWIGYKDPDIYRYVFSSRFSPPNGGNRGWYQNPQLDELLDKGQQSLDPSLRKKIYQKVQAIVASELPYIFLWHKENIVVYNAKLKNFTPYADGRLSALRQINWRSVH